MGGPNEVSFSVDTSFAFNTSITDTLTIAPNGIVHKLKSRKYNNQMDGGNTTTIIWSQFKYEFCFASLRIVLT
jgi:hypothetical protein